MGTRARSNTPAENRLGIVSVHAAARVTGSGQGSAYYYWSHRTTTRFPAYSRIHAFTHSLTRTRQDETVLFDPVAAAPDALNVVYAYPNEYTVGITSLGYQLVWAYLETSELTSVSRRCGYCNSIDRSTQS